MWRNPELRADARFHLKGSWSYAIVICLIASLIASTIQSLVGTILGTSAVFTSFYDLLYRTGGQVSEGEILRNLPIYAEKITMAAIVSGIVTLVLSVFFTLPFAFSVNNWFVRNRETPAYPPFSMVFSHFSCNYGRLVTGRLWEGLWTVIWGSPYYVGSAMIAISSLQMMTQAGTTGTIPNPELSSPLWMLYLSGVALLLLGLIPWINRSLAYAMNAFILADNPGIGHRRSLQISKRMMKGNKLHLIGLNLSFLGWILLSLLTCGIGMLFVTPYMNQTMAELYAKLRSAAVYRGDTTMEELGFVLSAPMPGSPGTQPPVTDPYAPNWQNPYNG